jgi:hypothetical protein
MNKKILIISIIVFVLLLIIGIVIFFVLSGKETEDEEPVVALTSPPSETPVVVSTTPPPSSQTIPPSNIPSSSTPVDATCLNVLDPSYYSFAEESVLGKDLIGTGNIERFAFERFALSGTNFIDASKLDPNKYYKIGTLITSNTLSPAQNGGNPCVEFPKVIYKEDITSCSNRISVTINLRLSSSSKNSTTGLTTYNYDINQSGNVTFSNFNTPTITAFPRLPTVLLLNTTNSLPSSVSISYSNLTTTGFTYTLRGSYTDYGSFGTASTQIFSSFTYFAST